MRVLIVAERELRAAARRKATYRVRWITAVLFFALLVWLLWLLDGFTRRGAAVDVFQAYAGLLFVYCIVLGAGVTADCLSAERREGTLGLLFLTNLNSAEIVGGKFCSAALTAVYGLMAVFPMLALPLLMGGITLAHFWRTVLALLVTTFFSMSAGFVATTVCRRQFVAIAFALGLGLVAGAGWMGAVAGLHRMYQRQLPWVDELAAFCPLYSLVSADGTAPFITSRYWFSIVAVMGVAFAWLAFATWRLARTWRDQPKSARFTLRLWSRKPRPRSGRERHAALRRRLLDINPFFWLSGRELVSSPGFMLAAAILVALGSLVVAPFLARSLNIGSPAGPLVGHLFGWFWTALAIHALTVYFAAMTASQRLAEDKETGALELVLSTPTSERTIARGLWLAYARRMLFPALLATLVHLFFAWQFVGAFRSETPEALGRGLSDWQVFWRAVLDLPMSGGRTYWQMGFMLRCLMLALGLLVIVWITLGWVGRWLGLRMKHPGFAPVAALAFVFAPPVVIFSVACYLSDVLDFDRWPEQQFLTAMMWLAVSIGVAHCGSLALWARGHLRRDFRAEAMSRFQPAPSPHWGRILWRLLRRAAMGLSLAAAVFAMIALAFYGYQNRRARQRWATFEQQLKLRGESLDFTKLRPKPVPDEANFARSPAFLALEHPTNALTKVSSQLRIHSLSFAGGPNVSVTLAWNSQKLLPLADAAALLGATSSPPPPIRSRRAYSGQGQVLAESNRTESAAQILSGLQPFDASLSALALAARKPFFQIATNGSAFDLLNPHQTVFTRLENVHGIFVLRACAALEMNRTAAAAEDLFTSLRLANLARQSPDVSAIQRAQALLVTSLQPLWEGVVRHQWTEPQLAGFQSLLAPINFLADYTNAVPRVALAYIESWQAVARGDEPRRYARIVGGHFDGGIVRSWQPRSWWLESCIQVHEAAQSAVGKMDVTAGRVDMQMNWEDINGLPLDQDTQSLLQQPTWSGANPAIVVFAQAALNQAILACALERHFLARGRYPESLTELQPQFIEKLPTDPVRGRPMNYERVDDRHYILRSFGPNTVNDRKVPASDDWLWRFPTNAPAVPLR